MSGGDKMNTIYKYIIYTLIALIVIGGATAASIGAEGIKDAAIKIGDTLGLTSDTTDKIAIDAAQEGITPEEKIAQIIEVKYDEQSLKDATDRFSVAVNRIRASNDLDTIRSAATQLELVLKMQKEIGNIAPPIKEPVPGEPLKAG